MKLGRVVTSRDSDSLMGDTKTPIFVLVLSSVTIEFYYIWREHANLCSVNQLKPKTWLISDESSRHLTPSHAI